MKITSWLTAHVGKPSRKQVVLGGAGGRIARRNLPVTRRVGNAQSDDLQPPLHPDPNRRFSAYMHP